MNKISDYKIMIMDNLIRVLRFGVEHPQHSEGLLG